MVIKSIGSSYHVRKHDGNTIVCKLPGKLRLNENKGTNPVTVGDNVEFEIDHDFGIIRKILERKNYIIRRSTNLSKQHHILAANIDHAYLIATLTEPETTTTFIDRFLVTAEAYRIPASIIFNKSDLFTENQKPWIEYLTKTYEAAGYKCIKTSTVTRENIDLLIELFKDKLNLLSGHSGVGKSTIINSIAPDLKLKTAAISKSHKTGKHTTTFSEIFCLKTGGFIIDTPGIKAFGLIDMKKDEIYHFFPEIFIASKECKYYNCTHLHEPNCNVIKKVQDGSIGESRYISYLGMMSEDTKYR